jgi:hypothetical protein
MPTCEDLLMGAFRLSLCACAFALLATAPSEAGSYDGQWTVQLSTEQGACALQYQGTLKVADGRIQDSGMFIQTAGTVDPSGRVSIRIMRGAELLAAGGKLQGQAGSGQWNLPSKQCSGRWQAARV